MNTLSASAVPWVACGIVSSRSRSSNSLVAASCGALVGMAKIVAISPSWLGVAGAAWPTPSVPATASCNFVRSAWTASAPPAVSTAMMNGPFEPAPNAAVRRS